MKQVKEKPHIRLTRSDPMKIEQNKKRKLQQHLRKFPSDHAAQKTFTKLYGEPAMKGVLSNLLAVARHKIRYLRRKPPMEHKAPIEQVS